MIYKSLFFKSFLLFLAILSSSISLTAQANIDEGKALFKLKCNQCHNKNMKDDLTGPALGGYEERWEGREELLYEWVKNSQTVIASGDDYANSLYAKWNNTLMNPFPELSNEQIDNIFAYVRCMNDGSCLPVSAVAAGPTDGNGGGKTDNTLLFATLFIILGLLAIVLSRIISNLNYVSRVREGEEVGQRETLVDLLTSKSVIGFAIFALVILGGYMTVDSAINLNRQQGYAPEQPINFSHATHAGLHEIDCQYCHDGARRSKHAVIPAANTCMNCHKAIKKGSEHGTAELTKIFASIGFNPNDDTYIEDYEDLSEEEIETIYKKWIGDTYMKTNSLEELDSEGESVVSEQWSDLKSSLTNDLKSNIQGPIEWVRIHNLPDHVYFNHSQHVNVGKVECQQCHGKVEEMDLLQQSAPLSMGWCINCHRQTEIQFKDNDYYKAYEAYHDELKDGSRTGVTVEDIGGLECQKCHY